jgi:hypothetical protein
MGCRNCVYEDGCALRESAGTAGKRQEEKAMGKKSRMSDLNDCLFGAIEALSDRGLKGDALKEEIERAKAVSAVAGRIIEGGRLALDAAKAAEELPGAEGRQPLLSEG